MKALNAGVEGINNFLARLSEEDEDEESENEIDGQCIEVPKRSVWENHFEDTEKSTTVTIVEGLNQGDEEDLRLKAFPATKPMSSASTDSKTPKSKLNDKKKRFRYLTKHEQKANSKKARLKRLKAR